MLLGRNIRDSKLRLSDAITDPMETHVDCLGPLLLDAVGGNADGARVVAHDDGGSLGVAHVGERCSNRGSVLSCGK